MYELFSHITAPAPRYVLRLAVLDSIFKSYFVKLKRGYKVLEVGPGLGDLISFFEDRDECSNVTALEFSEAAGMVLEKRFFGRKKVRCVADNVFFYRAPEQYDAVLMMEVMEHIEDDVGLLQKLHQSLAHGGLLVLSVPAYMKKWQKQDEYSGHIRRYEALELNDKLVKAGFSSVEIKDYGFPLTSLMYPFRQMAYKEGSDSTVTQKTKNSGVDRPFFGRLSIWVLLPIYLPFIWLQLLFLGKGLGDGFVAVAKKS